VTSDWDEVFRFPTNSGIGDLVAFEQGTRSQTFLVFDVTDLVRSWLTGTENFGVALLGVPAGGEIAVPAINARIDSKENTGTGHLPTLQMVLVSGAN
jgi:hypothetical protein